jgi:predicted PurR-regulated permease PerM
MPFPAPSQRQASLIWKALTGLAIALLVALVAALVWGFGKVLGILSPVLWPIAVAGVLAYLLDPLVDFFERKRVPRSRAIVCVFLLAFGIMVAMFGSVVPQIINESRQLISRFPAYSAQLQAKIEYWAAHPPKAFKGLWQVPAPAPAPAPGDAETNSPGSSQSPTTETPASASNPGGTGIDKGTLQNAGSIIAKNLPEVGSWLFGQFGRVASWFGILAGLALIPVYTFYFLLEKRGISSHWTNYLPISDSDMKQELVFILNSVNNYLIAFFRGQVMVAICDGILYTIGFLIIGLPYAILIGAVGVFLTMIPFLGAIVICVAALVISIVQFGDWLHPMLVLAIFAVVQTLEGLVISPKIMGDRVGLHPLTIIISVMAGTTLLGGLLGGILAIPLTAAMRVLMFRYVWKRPDTQVVSNRR